MKYSKDRIKEILSYLEDGATQKSAAMRAGIAEDTFYEWMKKPEFSVPIKKAEYKRRDVWVKRIEEDGSWQSKAWLLERIHHDEFALKNVMKLQGENGGALTIKVVNYGNNSPA